MIEKLNRRSFMVLTGAVGLVAMLPGLGWAAEGDFSYKMTDDQWKQKLSPEQYRVLREEGTERAFTSSLNKEEREGVYHCAGCEQPLFSSAAKYDSGTGWPSFFQPVESGAVGTTTDYKLVYPRTEVHCSNCGGHLGHIFDDGPAPTGKRFCINGVSLSFKPTT
jgi:peptide-methionine (R)-S-oxide reductase